ncbi:hypothetical protein [uncultured Methylobacterium sp.]|uniref:hypothetical protein n=1 Tax=uncultured Methylobacterium sp. TaxID=157278 RepID=UPI0035CBB224
MTAALRDRISELEETIRQMRAAFAPRMAFPAAWKLKPRDAGILAALYAARGSHVSSEAMILWVEGAASLSIDVDARCWVGALRTKLQPLGIAIEVRPGCGYSLTPAGRAVIAAAIGEMLPVMMAPAPPAPSPGRPAHPRGWQAAEDAIVRAGFARDATLPVLRVELLAAGFRERSLSAISTRAHTIGLTNTRAASPWSPPEDAIVAGAYEDGATLAAIRLRLAEAGFVRNRGAIQMRAIALGISGGRVRTWSEPERRIVHQALKAGATHQQVIDQLAAAGYERGRTSIAKMAASMGFHRGEPLWKADEDRRLGQLYAAKMPVRLIAKELGRPVGGIASRASKLGFLQRQPRPRAVTSNLAEASA